MLDLQRNDQCNRKIDLDKSLKPFVNDLWDAKPSKRPTDQPDSSKGKKDVDGIERLRTGENEKLLMCCVLII
jgi:hypothetical protein